MSTGSAVWTGSTGPTSGTTTRRSASAKCSTGTPAARLDRNFAEILQELRIAETGVQILFAFLLGMAFQQRFAEIDGFQRVVYVATLLVSALATGVLIAPVVFHRLVFRRHRKDAVVRVASRLLLAGVTLVMVAVLGGVLLVLDWVTDHGFALMMTAVLAVVLVTLWFVLPFARHRAIVRAEADTRPTP